MYVKGAHFLVMGAVVVFRLVVAKILLAWMIAHTHEFLCFLTHQPKISHVHRARSLPFYGAVDDADGRRIVAVNWNGGLRVSHLFKGESHYFCFDGVEE